MKQVVQDLRTGAVTVLTVPPPQLRSGGALVLTRASLISTGTERSKITLGKKSIVGKARARPDLTRKVLDSVRREGLRSTYDLVSQRLQTPSPLGYSACGVVAEVAADVAGIRPGDLVSCAGAGYANHAEVNFVPANLLAKVPGEVTPEQAAYASVGAVALHGVRQAEVALGERFLVIGLGLVGLLAVQIARAAGARVQGTDIDPAACALALSFGADRTEVDPTAFSSTMDEPGFDAVLICAATNSSQPIDVAAELCRDRGRVVVLGAVGMTLPREPFYEKELELRLSRSYGPGRYDYSYEEYGNDYPIGYVRWTEQRNLEEALRLLDVGAVDVDRLTTHRYPLERAAEAYAAISDTNGDRRRPLGVVLTYDHDREASLRPRVGRPSVGAAASGETVGVAVVGAGNFATRVLLPLLQRDERVVLVGVATSTGIRARHAAERYGFQYATSAVDSLIEDPEVHAVVIATRHDSHASLAARAIRAGKAVFCEKPLATTWAQLDEVAAAYADHPVPLLVGFNRRFSGLTRALRGSLAADLPRAVLCRVNAGGLPADHWTRDPHAGGGRVVGEACHFLDLACHLAEGRPLRIAAERVGEVADESVVIEVAFTCGSVASVQYLTNGDTAVAKERIEVFCGGMIGLIDDFRTLEIAKDGRRRNLAKARGKGHREEIDTFISALVSGTSLPVEEMFWSSALTLQIHPALEKNGAVAVSLPRPLLGTSHA